MFFQQNIKNQAVNLVIGSVICDYLHGVAQFQLKDFEGGKKLLEEAVKRQPNGTYATLAKRWLQSLASRIGESNDKTAGLNQSPLAQRTE